MSKTHLIEIILLNCEIFANTSDAHLDVCLKLLDSYNVNAEDLHEFLTQPTVAWYESYSGSEKTNLDVVD